MFMTKKKLIAVVSTSMILGFAIALANAEDSTTGYGNGSSNVDQRQQQPQQPQQPGVAGSEAGGAPAGSPPGSIDAMTSKGPGWKEASTCIDENGNTLKRGEEGFESCIQRMRRQEGGQQGASSSADTGGASGAGG